jgi:hypothetical protein
VKRALAAVLLVSACSHSAKQAAPTPTPTPSPTVTTTAAPRVTSTPSPTPSPTAAAFTGPVGTKVPRGFHPTSATFISDRTGWVLGASPCPSGKGSCDVIARTTDAGATWRAIPSPRTSPEHLAQIRFADLRNGFVTGDQLWATHDGGATWTVVPREGSVSQLAVAKGRVWLLVDQDLRSGPVTGGATQHVDSPVTAFALQGTTVAYTFRGSELFVGSGDGSSRKVAVPCAQGDTPVVGLGATHWLLVCEGGAGLGHQEKQAFRSEDRGRTWQPSGQPPPRTGTDPYVTGDGDFVLDHQEVAVYREGSWETALASNGGLSEGGFESSRLGFAIGGFDDPTYAQMKITHDAGRTWSTIRF